MAIQESQPASYLTKCPVDGRVMAASIGDAVTVCGQQGRAHNFDPLPNAVDPAVRELGRALGNMERIRPDTALSSLLTFMELEVEGDVKRLRHGFALGAAEDYIVRAMVADTRGNILTSQVGDLARYISHDPAINPGTRPHGSRQDEAATFGHALLQLLGLAAARGFSTKDFMDGVSTALDALKQRDWAARSGNGDGTLKGKLASWPFDNNSAVHGGFLDGVVALGMLPDILDRSVNTFLVVQHARADIVTQLERLRPGGGIITDHGGTTSHGAILARERRLVAIVDTGDATMRLKDGQRIRVHASGAIELLEKR